eukprot:7782855-Alexandrium_andersonii.AAC.1
MRALSPTSLFVLLYIVCLSQARAMAQKATYLSVLFPIQVSYLAHQRDTRIKVPLEAQARSQLSKYTPDGA